MVIIKQLNDAIAYIENNLCGEIDTNKIAEIAICPYDKFKRFFSYMTNMSFSEYIRKRRLSHFIPKDLDEDSVVQYIKTNMNRLSIDLLQYEKERIKQCL